MSENQREMVEPIGQSPAKIGPGLDPARLPGNSAALSCAPLPDGARAPADGVVLSPLVEHERQTAVAAGRSETRAGEEAAKAPREAARSVEVPSQPRESSSQVPLRPARRKGSWDHLLIRDAILVLQERLGGMNAAIPSVAAGTIPRAGGDEMASVGVIAALGDLTSVKAVQGGGTMFAGDRLGGNFTGGTVFQLVRDYQAAKGEGITLQVITEQLATLALRSAGIDQDNLDWMRRGTGNFRKFGDRGARSVA